MRHYFFAAIFLASSLLLAACGESVVQAPALSLQEALGGSADARYLRAAAPREFSFPADHGLHPGFRNEWWYLTGNLEDDAGRRFGYQLTFFYLMLPPAATVTASAWQSERVWMAHLALTDVTGNNHYAFERFARENPGLAGAQAQPFKVWLEDWQVSQAEQAGQAGQVARAGQVESVQTNGIFPWQLQAQEASVGLSLVLQQGKPPVLQGEQGLSRKSAAVGNASYYYSMTRLPTSGAVRIGEQVFNVVGDSWLDREWSTSALDADQTGWDWFSLQFNDGQELMYYQLRDSAGQAHPYSAGSWTDTAGQQTLVSSADVQLMELEQWSSPSGMAYATTWLLRYQGRELQVKAVLPDQWMALSLPYWEGAVDVTDAATGTLLGRGYLEMVR